MGRFDIITRTPTPTYRGAGAADPSPKAERWWHGLFASRTPAYRTLDDDADGGDPVIQPNTPGLVQHVCGLFVAQGSHDQTGDDDLSEPSTG